MFFIHLSIDEQLCYFHILPISNSAAMNIGVHVSFWISVFDFFLDIHLRVNLLDHGSSIFSFLRNPYIVFAHFATQIYIPTNYVWGFPFHHILTNQHLFCVGFLMLAILTGVRFWLWLWFAFPWWLMMLRNFSCAWWPYAFPLCKNVYVGILPTFGLCFLVFYLELYELFIYFGY